MYVKVVKTMKKILVIVILLFLSGCTPSEEKSYRVECEKVSYCNLWLEENEDFDYAEGIFLDEVKSKLEYFGDNLEEVQENIKQREEIFSNYDSLELQEQVEEIIYEVLPKAKDEYEVSVVLYDDNYFRIEVFEFGPFSLSEEHIESIALDYVIDMIDVLYNEMSFYYTDQVNIDYTLTIKEVYLEGFITYETNVEYIDKTFYYQSNDEQMKWEYVRNQLFRILDYNTFIRLDPLITDPETPTIPRNRLEGLTLDKLFTALEGESYDDKALEIYYEVRSVIEELGAEFEEFDFQVTIMKNYFILDILIDDDQINQTPVQYKVPLDQYFNRKFDEAIDESFIEDASFNFKELHIEFNDDETITVYINTFDTSLTYQNTDELDLKIRNLMIDLKQEFSNFGYSVHTVVYNFKVALDIEGERVVIEGEHVDSEDPIIEVDWEDSYIVEYID